MDVIWEDKATKALKELWAVDAKTSTIAITVDRAQSQVLDKAEELGMHGVEHRRQKLAREFEEELNGKARETK